MLNMGCVFWRDASTLRMSASPRELATWSKHGDMLYNAEWRFYTFSKETCGVSRLVPVVTR